MKIRNRSNFLFASLVGIVVSLAFILLGNWLLTVMITSERMGEGSEVYAVPALIMIATVIGILVNWRLENKRRKCTPLIMAVITLSIMLIGGLLLDGPFRGFGSNLAAVGAGCVVSYIFCLKKSADFRNQNRRYR